jgi:hypothetical protein
MRRGTVAQMESAMTADNRFVRFANIDGLTRDDLPLAYEMWLQDLYRAPWASKEMMKLGALFVRYMVSPTGGPFSMGEIEIVCQIAPEEVRKTLAGMKGFGAIDSFVCAKAEAKVALNLSLLQRLQVLEAKRRFAAVMPGAQRIWTTPGETWVASKSATTVLATAAVAAAAA